MSSHPASSSPNSKLRLLAGILLLLWNRLLLSLGVRRRVDGWRRAAGVALRGEAARFVLSAFHLDVMSDVPQKDADLEATRQHLSERLAAFLLAETEFHKVVRQDGDVDRVVPHAGPAYTLAFEPWVDGPQRFIRPDAWAGQAFPALSAGELPLFEFVCRIDPDRLADVWVRIHHVGTDGVPAQEMLSRLEKAWGIGRPLVVPARDPFEPFTEPRPSPGRAGTAEVQTFIDFGRLLAWRKRQNEALPEPMTFAAAVMWWLARHEAFSSLYLGTTVELPAMDGIPRGVGVVVARPAQYSDRPDGLVRYVRTFNRELNRTRQRRSVGCRILDAAAFLPPKLEDALLRHALDEGAGAFGSLGLTILKDAKVFGAPLADAGHEDGFIAIGSTSLESADGRRVGCVVVKGPQARIADYATTLREALEDAPGLG